MILHNGYQPMLFAKQPFLVIINIMASLLASEILFFFCIVLVTSQPTDITLEALYDKVRSLVKKHSDLSSLTEIGRSVENRPIYVVKIQNGSAQQSTVVLEFGIHARELASPASGLYLLEKLLTNSACNGLLEQIRWYVIPVLNPDGYKYAVETGQLWRKNRASIPSSSCVGIDLNRNFAVGWENQTDSHFYCRETYCGQKPVSEPESIALKEFLDGLIANEDVIAYLAVHTCAAGMFYPYGYKREKAKNFEELELVGNLMRSSIRNVSGFEYVVGPAYELGLGGGGVDDWVYNTYHVPLVYTFELGNERRWPSNVCFFPSARVTERLKREFFAGIEALALHIEPHALTPESRIKCGHTPDETDRLTRECFAGVEALASYVNPNALAEDDKTLCYDDSKTPLEEMVDDDVPNRATINWYPVVPSFTAMLKLLKK